MWSFNIISIYLTVSQQLASENDGDINCKDTCGNGINFTGFVDLQTSPNKDISQSFKQSETSSASSSKSDIVSKPKKGFIRKFNRFLSQVFMSRSQDILFLYDYLQIVQCTFHLKNLSKDLEQFIEICCMIML